MNVIYSGPFSEDIVERLGWTLVHSLWQFATIALVADIGRRALRHRSATSRYLTLVVALALVAVAPVVTWQILPGRTTNPVDARDLIANWFEDPEPVLADAEQGRRALPPSESVRAEVSPPTGVSPIPDSLPPVADPTPVVRQLPMEKTQWLAWSVRIRQVLKPWIGWLVAAWSLGVLICSFRPLLGWRMLWRLRRVGVAPASDEVIAALRHVSERLGLNRTAHVCQSTLAQAPLVVGYLRPIILLPASLLTSLPPAQLEAILAHELAHVQRHDFVINLLQAVVETLFFYHPGVWWLSHRIRVEREHCCDDLVVSLLNNRVDYGRALLAIEELHARQLLLASGASDGSLLARVRRIVDPPEHRVSFVESWPAGLLSLGLIGAIALLTLNWNLQADDRSGVNHVAQADSQTPARNSAPVIDDAAPSDAAPIIEVVNADRGQSIDGVVVDDVTGKPIEGATVRFRFKKLPGQAGGPPVELVYKNVGQYEFRVPEDLEGNDLFVELIAEHPDYQSRSKAGQMLSLVLKPGHAQDFIRQVRLSPGRIITGQVLDLDGKPAVGIPVFAGRNRSGYQNGNSHETVTGADGRYRLVVPDQLHGRIYVVPSHASAVSRAISPEFGEQQAFKLLRGTRLEGTVTDVHGHGVAGVIVRVNGTERVPWRFAVTDQDGKYSTSPCQYGKYSIELLDGGMTPGGIVGATLPDVYRNQILELSKSAPLRHELNFQPTESVRVTARYVASDDQPVRAGHLTVSGSVNGTADPWGGTFREIADQPGLYEVRVPRGLEGALNQNHYGGFLRVTREITESRPFKSRYQTTFDKDGIAFFVRRYRSSTVTLLPTFQGQPVNPTGPLDFPVFADAEHAARIGARVASSQSTRPESGGLRFDVHPDIDIDVKLQIPGYQLWRRTIRFAEGVNTDLDVELAAIDAAAAMPDPKTGIVEGTIRVTGPVPPMPPISVQFGSRYKSRLENLESPTDLEAIKIPNQSLLISQEGGLANAFVYLKTVPPGLRPAVTADAAPFVVTSDLKQFTPHAAVIRTGRSVTLKNATDEADNFHQGDGQSPVNMVVAAQSSTPLPAQTFQRAESLPVTFRSDIHPWKQPAFVLPLDHPFAAVTDANGRFQIAGLPPGDYSFVVWHERTGYLERKLAVTVKAGKTTQPALAYPIDRFAPGLKPGDARVIQWSKAGDGWSAGVAWAADQTEFTVGKPDRNDPVSFRLLLRNDTDQPITIPVPEELTWDFGMQSRRRLNVRIHDRGQTTLTLASHEVRPLDVPRPHLDVTGLEPGFWLVTFATPFGKEALLLDLWLNVPVPAWTVTQTPRQRQQPQSRPEYQDVRWGVSLQGLRLGVRLKSDPADAMQPVPQMPTRLRLTWPEIKSVTLEPEYFLWNATSAEVEVSMLNHTSLDWGHQFTQAFGPDLSPLARVTGPKFQMKHTLQPDEVWAVGRSKVTVFAPDADIPAADTSLKLPSGDYGYWSFLNLHRIDQPQINLLLETGIQRVIEGDERQRN
ncbi:MAG: M48 family metalloprotease [Planctomycetes bacterium]|nr:M48 family metalloprotease [Planctomycetota bacterium]